jgi:zinc-finger binding domain of transposase IS66/Transposase C of IS166 homeodomain
MTSTADSPLPNDVATLQTMLLSERAARMAAESEAKFRALLIEKLKYTIAKLRHDKFGQSSERGAILEQLELSLADLEEDASAAATAAQMAAAQAKIEVRRFERRKPARRPLPERLPRERIVYPAPASCPCCGGVLHKIGEDVTETLELIPRQWKVVQHVREKFSCRSCESITQPPAPSHPIARGRAGPKLLAHVLFLKIRPASAAQSPELALKVEDAARFALSSSTPFPTLTPRKCCAQCVTVMSLIRFDTSYRMRATIGTSMSTKDFWMAWYWRRLN